MRFFLPVVLLLGGCVASPITGPHVIGYYSSVSGFTAPRSLELKRDGTYGYVQYTREPQESSDGMIAFERWRHTGKWLFIPPDKIELHRGDASRIDLFVRRSPAYGLVILEPHLVPDILSTWSTDTGPLSVRLLKKRKPPNNAPEPTTLLVTPPAGPEVAPSKAVAQL